MRDAGGNGIDGSAPVLFREVQHFRIWRYWVPILVVTGLVWYEFYQQIVRNDPSGSSPIPDWGAWALAIVFGLGFPVMGLMLALVTEVRPGEVRVRVFPFRGSRVSLREVTEAEVRQYSAQREYGGWGVRTTPQAGKAYTAYGVEGVQMWLRGGERLLIGTQKAEEFVDTLRKAGVFVR